MIQEESRYFINIENAPKFKQREGLITTILTGLKGETMMMALNATLPGHTVPVHAHEHEQIGMVYAGMARLKIGDEERIVQKGDIYCIPPNVPHGDTCLSDEPFVMFDIFYPKRMDFINQLKSKEIYP